MYSAQTDKIVIVEQSVCVVPEFDNVVNLDAVVVVSSMIPAYLAEELRPRSDLLRLLAPRCRAPELALFPVRVS